MNKFKSQIAIILSLIMILSVIKVDVSIAEDLETRVSLLLKKVLQDNINEENSVIDAKSRQVVKDSLINTTYELKTGEVISYSILRDYEMAVYIVPYKDVSSYKGEKDLKNGEYRYLGYTFDGKVITNPRYMDDATSSVDLRNKDWQILDPDGKTYKEDREEQFEYLFKATLYDPIGSDKRPIGMTIKDILRKKIPSGDDKIIKTYSQMGSPPTLNNEGSIMIKHKTSSGEWYDSFVVDKLDLGAIYTSEIVKTNNYIFEKNQPELTVDVVVNTKIDLTDTDVKSDVIFAVEKQKIEFQDKNLIPTYLGDDTLTHTFPITLKRDALDIGENIIDLSAVTHLKSIYGDEKDIGAVGQITVVIPSTYLSTDASSSTVDFDILKGSDAVTDSILSIDGEIEKKSIDETIKESIKRLDLEVDLILKEKIIADFKSINWFIFNNETGNYDYFAFGSSNITKKINKDNVDKYTDNEGKAIFKMYVIDKYGFSSSKIHHTTVELNYKNVAPPVAPEGKAPIAHVRSVGGTRAGSIISFSASRSKDSDGYITDYSFDGSMTIIKVNSSGKTGYATPLSMGNESISVTVTDDSGLTDSDSAYIDVSSPIIHNEVFRGKKIVNRKITLDSTLDQGTTYYPSSHFETSWEITPLEGQNINSIKWDTNNQGKLVDVLFKEAGIYNIKKIIRAKCTHSDGAGMYISEEKERGIKILPDEDPVSQFAVVKYNLRQVLDDRYATIKVYDTSYSPDLDKIYKRTWWYKYDANNNGSFDDEVLQLFDSENDLKEIALRVKDVGRYEFRLSVEEDFTDETIARFITSNDIHTDDSDSMEIEKKFAEVLNVAPVVKLEERANKKVDMIVVTDYLASDRASLESDISLLTKSMQEKKLNLIPQMINMNDTGNSIVVGQRIVPVFKYSRYARLSLHYDELYYHIQDERNYSLYGEDAIASYPYLKIDSALATDKEALLLPKFPLTYATEIYQGRWDNALRGSHTSFQFYAGGSFKIYDEPNLLRDTYYYGSKYDVRLVIDSINYTYCNYGANYPSYSYPTGDIRKKVVEIDKEYIKEEQVSTRIENIMSVNTDIIKNMTLDENSDKYLVILTKNEDSLKSFDDTFIEYAKSKGFIIRYSIPQLAMEQSAKGYEFDDVRFKDKSMVLKSGDKYFEIGNVSVSNLENAMSPTYNAQDIALFNTNDPELVLKGQSIKIKMPNGVRVIEESPYNYNYATTDFAYNNLYYDGNKIYGLGVSLTGVKAIHYTKLGVLCEMNDGNVKFIQMKKKYDVIDIPWKFDRRDRRVEQYLPNLGSYFRNLELEVVDTGLTDVVNISSSYQSGWYIKSRESGKVETEGDYTIKLLGLRVGVTDSKGYYFENTTHPTAYGEFLQDWSDYPKRKMYKMGAYLNVYKRSYQRGIISNNNSVSIEGGVDFDKMYLKDNYTVYIKDGEVYGKGNSSKGQLGVVGYVSDFKKITNITINDDAISYVTPMELHYNPQNKSYSSKSDILSSILNDYNDYSTDETLYRLVDEPLEMDTFYFDYEGDPLQDVKYDYTHTEIFDNSMGIDPLNGTSTKELVKTYSKVGKYVIKPRYQDNPKDIGLFNNYWLWNQDNTKVNLIVHRKPMPKLRTSYEMVGSDTFVTLGDGGSFDLDHTSMSNKGITNIEMLYKFSTDTTFTVLTEGLKLKVDPLKTINVIMRVQDFEGVWSDWIEKNISTGTITYNEAPNVNISKTEPSVIYEGDDIKNYIMPTDPDGDLLTVEYYVAKPGQLYSLYKTYLNVTPGVEFGLDKVLNSDSGTYKFKVVVSDSGYTAEDTKNISVNKISVDANLLPNDPMAGDMLYFNIETVGFADRIEIIFEDDIINNDERVAMGYGRADYVGNSLFFSITNPLNLNNLTTCEYIVWVSTPQSLTLKNVRNRSIYSFEVKAYRGAHVSDAFVIEKEIKGDVRQTLKYRVK